MPDITTIGELAFEEFDDFLAPPNIWRVLSVQEFAGRRFRRVNYFDSIVRASLFKERQLKKDEVLSVEVQHFTECS